MRVDDRRRRAVRLTSQGLEALQGKLIERFDEFAERHGKRKLTREVSAELLGVSVRTAGRILEREPVDRSSLLIAFRAVKASWQEAYCERVEATGSNDPEGADDSHEAPKQTQRRFSLLNVIAVVAIASAGFFAAWVYASHPALPAAPPQPSWDVAFTKQMDDATAAYHRADYVESRRLVRLSKPDALKYHDAAAIAWVHRMEGDLFAVEGKLDAAIASFELATAALRAAELWTFYYSALEASANAKVRAGKLEAANIDYVDILQHAKQTHVSVDMSAAYRGLGTVAHRQKRYREALLQFDLGLASLKPDEEVDMQADLRARKALVLSDLGQFKEGLAELKRCLAHWETKNHPRWIATTRYQLGLTYRQMRNDLAAAQVTRLALVGFQKVGDKDGEAQCADLLRSLSNGDNNEGVRVESLIDTLDPQQSAPWNEPDGKR